MVNAASRLSLKNRESEQPAIPTTAAAGSGGQQHSEAAMSVLFLHIIMAIGMASLLTLGVFWLAEPDL